MEMDYFTFYNLPRTFRLNEGRLKRSFFEKSRTFHPDFYIQKADKEKEEALQWATYNNQAYQTLKNEDKRMKYILELEGVLIEGEKYQLPPIFLMQMMELNEEVMELSFQMEAQRATALKAKLTTIEQEMMQSIEQSMKDFDQAADKTALKKIKEFYFKKRYLLRIRESLSKFGG